MTKDERIAELELLLKRFRDDCEAWNVVANAERRRRMEVEAQLNKLLAMGSGDRVGKISRGLILSENAT